MAAAQTVAITVLAVLALVVEAGNTTCHRLVIVVVAEVGLGESQVVAVLMLVWKLQEGVAWGW